MSDEFQKRALRTWHSARFDHHLQRLHAVLGLVGEAGELSEVLKKDTFKPGHASTVDQRLDELGDVLYYVAILAYLDGATLEDVSRLNAEKLQDGHGWKPDHMNELELP
jgi:NTP pyrophosphatase (non-canonical NTP hydrolase)